MNSRSSTKRAAPLARAGLDGDLQRHAGQRGERRPAGGVEGQRHQGRPRLDDAVAELPRQPVAEVGGADLRDRQPAGGDHQRAARDAAARGVELEAVARRARTARTAQGCQCCTRAGARTRQQHVDDLLGRVVAEQLAAVLLVEGDAVALHQRDEVAAACSAPAPSGRSPGCRTGSAPAPQSRLVKLQRPPPEMRIFSATLAAWSSSSTRSPRWPAMPAQNRPAAPAPRR